MELQSAESDTNMIEAGFDLCIRISPHCDHDKLVYTELAANTRQLIATSAYLAAKARQKNRLIQVSTG